MYLYSPPNIDPSNSTEVALDFSKNPVHVSLNSFDRKNFVSKTNLSAHPFALTHLITCFQPFHISLASPSNAVEEYPLFHDAATDEYATRSILFIANRRREKGVKGIEPR